MFFFFIGGLQPKIKKVLQSNVGACLNCPTGRLDHVQTAQTLFAFFLPVYSFPDEELLHCDNCGFTTSMDSYKNYVQLNEKPPSLPNSTTTRETSCRRCGSRVKGGWRFCPKCGTQVV